MEEPSSAPSTVDLAQYRDDVATELDQLRRDCEAAEQQSSPAIQEALRLLDKADELVQADEDLVVARRVSRGADLRADRRRVAYPVAITTAVVGVVFVILSALDALDGWMAVPGVLLLVAGGTLGAAQSSTERGTPRPRSWSTAILTTGAVICVVTWPAVWAWLVSALAAANGMAAIRTASRDRSEDGNHE